MHPLQVVRCYSALLDAAADFARGHQELLVLTPARGSADDLVRLRLGNAAGVRRFTLPQYVAQVSATLLAERGLAPLNALGAEALATRAVYRVRQAAPLEYFEPVAASPGFARALSRTLRELRLEAVDWDLVGASGASGRDLLRLHAEFAELLAGTRLVDFAGMLRLVEEAIAAAAGWLETRGLVRRPLLLLDVPLTAALPAALVAALVRQAPAALALLVEGDESSAARYRRFLDSRAPDEAPDARSLDRLRQRLFASPAADYRGCDDSVECFSAAGEGLECIEIARRMQRLAAEGWAFDRMAILLRDPGRYQPLLEEALRRAGVPYYFTHGSVRPDPVGRAFLSLLACAAEDFPATRFAEYLSLGQAPPTESQRVVVVGSDDEMLRGSAAYGEPGGEELMASPATPAAWERMLVDAAVVGGRHRWQRRLQGLENELRLRLAEADDGDDAASEQLQRQLEQLRNLENLALPVIEQLAALPKQASWQEWLGHLTSLAARTLRRPESVEAALNELWSMGEAGPVTLDEVVAVLAGRLRFLRRPPEGPRYGQVWIGTIEEARGLAFDAVFLPGLAEGLFPRKAFEDPLLLDAARRSISPELATREDQVAAERLRLRIAAACATTRLVVSYPRMDVSQNRARVPSFYAMEVVRAAEGRLPELKTFERRAAAAAATRLGWPFPPDPADAVDDLEFDLALLQSALSLPRGQARGKGRFLLEANPHLRRALYARHHRWERPWSYADGLVDSSPETLAAVAHYGLRERPWSATTLQLVAACPYKFVLHGIHRLRPREEPVALQEMDPLTRGSLFHEVQFRLFRRAGMASEFAGHADAVLDEVAADYEERLAPAIPRVWKAEVEDVRADLHGWLRRMASDAAGWEVLHSEYAFGMPSGEERDPASRTEPARVLDGVQLKGSVDWIEIRQGGALLRITDHKTGKAPKDPPRFIGRGQYLQPLLYALAVEHHLGRPVAQSRLYFCTQRGGYAAMPVDLSEPAREALQGALALIDQQIRSARLPAAPGDKQCQWCDYQSVCGPREEERTRRKPPLPPLTELRNKP